MYVPMMIWRTQALGESSGRESFSQVFIRSRTASHENLKNFITVSVNSAPATETVIIAPPTTTTGIYQLALVWTYIDQTRYELFTMKLVSSNKLLQ